MLYTHVFLSYENIGIRDLWRIKEYYSSFENAYKHLIKKLDIGIFDVDRYEDLKKHLQNYDFQKEAENLKRQKIELITYDDFLFPENLKNTYLCPLGLYLLGNKYLLKEYQRFFAVVGPRNPSTYGKEITENFCAILAENGLILVSGFAKGIDAITHKTALQQNAKTIAVLGCNIADVYPRNHYLLKKEILEKGGLILSEYSPSYAIKKYNFSLRNRIISGISNGVLLTEAGERSGALITARYAFEEGRPLFTIPNSIYEEKSLGSNFLLKKNMAQAVLSPMEILLELGIKPSVKKEAMGKIDLTEGEEKIYKIFEMNKEKSTEELICLTKFPIKTVLLILNSLEIKGLIKSIGQNIYYKNTS